MSVDAHLASAAADERAAGSHRGAYDPNAPTPAPARSSDPSGCASIYGVYGPCWTEPPNPTAKHLFHTAKLRKAAQAHRDAAQELVDAESTSCVGLSADERDISPFLRVGDILSIEQLDATLFVVFRPVPGLTRAGLEKHIACHLARNASLGHAMPEMDYCPLVPAGISATVAKVPQGFEVGLRASTPEARADLQIRGTQLKRLISSNGQPDQDESR